MSRLSAGFHTGATGNDRRVCLPETRSRHVTQLNSSVTKKNALTMSFHEKGLRSVPKAVCRLQMQRTKHKANAAEDAMVALRSVTCKNQLQHIWL